MEKHDRLYGKDLNGMVATARIYDKMGHPAKATQTYQAIQRSGFSIPPDLEKYIKGRIAMKHSL
jgi:type IV pilus assembly protein PilQ